MKRLEEENIQLRLLVAQQAQATETLRLMDSLCNKQILKSYDLTVIPAYLAGQVVDSEVTEHKEEVVEPILTDHSEVTN